MQICKSCQLRVCGHKTVCPLCGGKLSGTPEEDVFPVLQQKTLPRVTGIRFAAFFLAVFLIGLIMIQQILSVRFPWTPLAIVLSLVSFFDVYVILYFRGNLIKTLTGQVYFVLLLTLVIDLFIQYAHWSIIWVIPITLAVMMIVTTAIGAGTHTRMEDYLLYLMLDTACSLLQLIFIPAGLNTFPLPAEICAAVCAVFFLSFVIFHTRELRIACERFFRI